MNPVYCNADGVCGSVLGMGKVRSSASMQAILLNPQLDLSQAYFLITGVAGTPPSRGTIGEVNWATWLVDYDLDDRWASEEGKPGEPNFMPRKGYEAVRLFPMNPALVSWAMPLTADTPLKDSEPARAYRKRYPQEAAQRAPFVGTAPVRFCAGGDQYCAGEEVFPFCHGLTAMRSTSTEEGAMRPV